MVMSEFPVTLRHASALLRGDARGVPIMDAGPCRRGAQASKQERNDIEVEVQVGPATGPTPGYYKKAPFLPCLAPWASAALIGALMIAHICFATLL